MGKPREHPPEIRLKILETLRKGVPFLALAAEANGVSRHTMETWLALGKNGDPRYQDFVAEAYQIRADFMLKHAQELLSADRETAERARQRNWLLSRLDRSIFDPPHQVYEKTMSRTTPAEHATHPTAADPNKVAEAVLELSQPLTLQ